MGRVMGCVNRNCSAFKKKTANKDENTYCFECGNKLYYVCSTCYTQLPEDSKKFCIRCSAKRKDTRNSVAKIGATMGIAALGVAKTVVKGIPDFK